MNGLLWLSFGSAWVAFAAWRYTGAAEYFTASILASIAFAICWLLEEDQ